MDMATPYRNYAAKLSIPGKSNDELTYTFHESSLEHHHAPMTLFGVFSIKSTSEQYQLLIAETVKNFLEYYRKTTESVSGKLKQDGINSREFIFENAIQYTHEHVTQALLEAQDEHGKIHGIDMKKVHFIIGILCEGQLYASITGNGIHALYFYPVYQKHGFSHYANVDIIYGNKESGDQGGSSRLFSSIISGSVSIPRSVLAICNTSFLDYISLEQLKQAVTGNPIEAVAPYFQRLLGKINAKNDFCALFLDAHHTPSAVAHTHQQTVSNESMAVLNSKEEGTEKILFPALAAQIKKIIPLFFRGIIFCVRTSVRVLRTWLPRIYKNSNVFFIRIIDTLKKILSKKNPRIRAETSIEVSQEKTKKPLSFSQFFSFISNVHAYIRSFLYTHIYRTITTRLSLLPHTSKSLLFISMIFLVLFGVSIVVIQKKNTDQKKQRIYGEMLRGAEEKNDLAEASLIYDNTEKARALLTEAQQLLREFPTDDIKNQERHKRIIERMEGITSRINHVVILKNISPLTQLDSTISQTDSLKLVRSNSDILLYNTFGVYAVDSTNGKITPISTQTKIPSLSCGIESTKKSLYLCDSGTRRIYELNSLSGSIQLIPLKLAKEETTIDSLALYNQKLYILAATQGTLFKHKKNKDGFEIGLPAIKNIHADTQKDISLSIDGNIYIIERSGQIIKYTSGKKESFILPLIDPQPTTIQKIWTDTDVSALYLFEPSQKRILVVDKKTRALKSQLISDVLAQAKDFSILKDKKLLLILSGTTLYQSPLDSL